MPVTKIHFDKMVISSKKGFVATNAADITVNNVKLLRLKNQFTSWIM